MSIGSFLVSIAAFYKDKGQGFIVIAVCKGTKLNNVCQKTKHIYLSPRRFPCFCALSVQSPPPCSSPSIFSITFACRAN